MCHSTKGASGRSRSLPGPPQSVFTDQGHVLGGAEVSGCLGMTPQTFPTLIGTSMTSRLTQGEVSGDQNPAQ